MYQIKFVKAPTLEFIQPPQARRAGVKVPEMSLASLLNPSNSRALNSSFKASALLMVTNDLGEDFYAEPLKLMAELHLHYQAADMAEETDLYLDTVPLSFTEFKDKTVLFGASKVPLVWGAKLREVKLELGIPAHTLVPKLKELDLKLMNYNVKHSPHKKPKSLKDPLCDELFLTLRVVPEPVRHRGLGASPRSEPGAVPAGIRGTYTKIRLAFTAAGLSSDTTTVVDLEDERVLEVTSLPMRLTHLSSAEVTVLDRFTTDRYCSRYMPVRQAAPEVAELLEGLTVLPGGCQGMVLLEELSHGIARHLWDAGIVVASMLPQLYTHGTVTPSVLELGTGIGIASIASAIALPAATYYATDLYDAKELCEFNIALNVSKPRSIRFEELDWEATEFPALPLAWTYVVIADCTYNPAYYDALLDIILKQVKGNTSTRVLLGHKFRDLRNDMLWFKALGVKFTIEREFWVKNGPNVMHLGSWRLK